MPDRKVSCAIIGLGFWGQVFLKKILGHPKFELHAVATRSGVSDLAPGVRIFKSVEELAREVDVDLYFILTSVDQHARAAKLLLKKSNNIFITKPIATDLKETLEIKKMAQKSKIFVDHTFLFNADFLYFKDLAKGSKIASSSRGQFGRFQKKSDVFGEFLYHDIYMFMSVFGRVKKVRALASKNLSRSSSGEFDRALLELEFARGVTASLEASMILPFKQRLMSVVSKKRIFTWQDMAPSIFTESEYQFAIGREGKITAQQTLAAPAPRDAIDDMLSHIADCVTQNKKSKSIDIDHAIEVMKVIEAARKSAQKNTAIQL